MFLVVTVGRIESRFLRAKETSLLSNPQLRLDISFANQKRPLLPSPDHPRRRSHFRATDRAMLSVGDIGRRRHRGVDQLGAFVERRPEASVTQPRLVMIGLPITPCDTHVLRNMPSRNIAISQNAGMDWLTSAIGASEYVILRHDPAI